MFHFFQNRRDKFGRRISGGRPVSASAPRLYANQNRHSTLDLSSSYQYTQKGDKNLYISTWVINLYEIYTEKCDKILISISSEELEKNFLLFQAFNQVEELFPLLLKTLSDPSDEVCEISSSNSYSISFEF